MKKDICKKEAAPFAKRLNSLLCTSAKSIPYSTVVLVVNICHPLEASNTIYSIMCVMCAIQQKTCQQQQHYFFQLQGCFFWLVIKSFKYAVSCCFHAITPDCWLPFIKSYSLLLTFYFSLALPVLMFLFMTLDS